MGRMGEAEGVSRRVISDRSQSSIQIRAIVSHQSSSQQKKLVKSKMLKSDDVIVPNMRVLEL